jgi:hypothetical protein
VGRKVSVGLSADVGEFIRNILGAKKSVDDLGDEVAQLDRELDKIPPDAAKASAALKLLDGSVTDVGRHVNDLGAKSTGLAVLDGKIKVTRGEIRKLTDEFIKTGDVDTFKKLGESQGLLQALTKTRKQLASTVLGGIEDGAAGAASSPQLRQAGIAIGGALAIPLAAALGGALAGGVGFGIAGAGIAGAVLGDPERFGFAWRQVLNGLGNDFINATAVFTGPTYAALSRIGPMVASWHLDDIFRNAVKYVEPLAQGVEGFATSMVRGVDALVEKGEPAVTALSGAMSRLGEAGQHAMEDIADGAEGGAMALHDAANAVALIVEGFGKAVQGAENLYGWIREHPFSAAVATGGMSIPISIWTAFDDQIGVLSTTQYGLQKAAEAAGHAFNQQGEDLTILSQKLNVATLSTDALAASMVNKLFSATMALDQSTLGVAQSLTRLEESFKTNGLAIDKHTGLMADNTAKGQANQEAILGAVTANMSLYQSQVAAGMSAEDAAAAYDANTAALEKQLRKAGLTSAQIDDLIGKYRGIPREVNTDIAVNGLTKAISELNTTLRLINGIHDKTVTVTVKQVGDLPRGQSRGGGFALGGIRRAAEGLIVPPSDPGTLIMGEPVTGGEAYIPLKGISQSRAMDLAQVVGDSYGFTVSAAQSRYANMRSTSQVMGGIGGGMPSELTLNATFLDPMTGDVMRRTAIRWSLDRGRSPADFLTAA